MIPWKYGTEPHLISFGDNVHIASEVSFITHDITHAVYNYKEKTEKYLIRQGEIKVGNNVFIGARSTILYDVSIGNNVIIGAGSLVNKDIPDNSVAVGVPCRVVGSFEEYKEKLRVMQE